MAGLGFVTPEEAEAAKKKGSLFSTGPKFRQSPHFSVYIRSYLEEKYGQDVVEQGGLKVVTTIDYPLQEKSRADSGQIRPRK